MFWVIRIFSELIKNVNKKMFEKQGLDIIGDCCVWLRLWARGNLMASTQQLGHAWSVRTRPTLDAFIPAAGLENIQLVHVLRTHVHWEV